MIRIGPTFLSDLQVAHVPLDGIVWGDDGVIQYRQDVPQVVRDQVAVVVAAHDPTLPAPDTSLSDGLARPEMQAILGVIAQQQGTTIDAIQVQAVTLHTAAIAAGASKSQAAKQ